MRLPPRTPKSLTAAFRGFHGDRSTARQQRTKRGLLPAIAGGTEIRQIIGD